MLRAIDVFQIFLSRALSATTRSNLHYSYHENFFYSYKYFSATEFLYLEFQEIEAIDQWDFVLTQTLELFYLRFDAQKKYLHHFPTSAALNTAINLHAYRQAHKYGFSRDIFFHRLTHYVVAFPFLVNSETQTINFFSLSSTKSLRQNTHCVSQIADKSRLLQTIIILRTLNNSHQSTFYA